MLGPHIFGCSFVTRFSIAIRDLQSASCSGDVRDSRYSSMLAAVGLVFASAMRQLLGEGLGGGLRRLTFELSRARQRGVLDSKRKMGRRPSACWPARRAVGARLERRVRPRASKTEERWPCDARDGATGRTGAAMAKRTATVSPAAEMRAAENAARGGRTNKLN